MGAWIEINIYNSYYLTINRRTPRWVRGLKSVLVIIELAKIQSHPTMGAWIEIIQD